MIDIDVQDWRATERFLRELPDQIARKMLNSALMTGAKPIMDQAKANVRERFGSSDRYTGTLEKAIARGRVRRTKYAAQVNVRIRAAKSRARIRKGGGQGKQVVKPYGDDAFYARFLEFGTSKMAPRPFLLPAANQRSRESINKFNTNLGKGMEKWCKANGVAYTVRGSLP